MSRYDSVLESGRQPIIALLLRRSIASLTVQ